MLFPHLLNRQSFVTESGELDKFFLNRLQSFLPLAVSNVGFCSLLASKPILFIQALNAGDFRPKTSYLFPQNFKMIHRCQDNSWREIAIALIVGSTAAFGDRQKIATSHSSLRESGRPVTRALTLTKENPPSCSVVCQREQIREEPRLMRCRRLVRG